MTVSVAYYWDRIDAGKCVASLACNDNALPGRRFCAAHMGERRRRTGYRGVHGGPKPVTIAFEGESLTVAEWASRLGVTTRRMRARLEEWPVEKALQAPRGVGRARWKVDDDGGDMAKPMETVTFNGRTQTVAEWATERGVSPTSMYRRLKDYPLEEALSAPPGFGRTGRPRGKPWNDDDFPMITLPKGGDHCGRCGLRGEHECLPGIDFYAAQQVDRGDASMDVTRKGVGKR